MRARMHAVVSQAARACEQQPNDPERWSDLGRAHAHSGELASAAQCFQRAVTIDSGFADGWHNLGTALKKLGVREAAFTALRNALLLNPSRADTYLNLGNLLIEAGQLEDALTCFERAAHHDPQLAGARSRLAEQVAQLGKVKQAEELFRQSVGLDPNHVQGWLGLGRTLEDVGDADSALACYRNVLGHCPHHALALGQYLALLKEPASVSLLANARQVLDDATVNDEARALVGYGLAKYHDKRAEYAAAATAGKSANAARRRAAGPLDRQALTARIDGIIATYDQEFFFQRRDYGLGTDQPVFIVGLPRSGTTLCEQILSSHPMLHGAGELSELSRVAVAALEGAGVPPWQSASRVSLMSSRALGMRYLRALREGAPKGLLRISDKSPLNFFQLALVGVLFPNARVIHCTRDARDNALSIWMENFNPEQGYATDFDDLAFFRAEYQRLMAHWAEVLPLETLELRYEDIVSDLEGQARRLIHFLGVPWDERCLAFHENDRAVQTPSRWQVRQPIYSRSVQRWQRYGPHIPELSLAFP